MFYLFVYLCVRTVIAALMKLSRLDAPSYPQGTQHTALSDALGLIENLAMLSAFIYFWPKELL